MLTYWSRRGINTAVDIGHKLDWNSFDLFVYKEEEATQPHLSIAGGHPRHPGPMRAAFSRKDTDFKKRRDVELIPKA